MPWVQPYKLNLGCGRDIRDGYVNADLARLEGVDLVFDMNQTPWPLDDDCCEVVLAKHCLEHLHDLIKPVEEIWRVCRHGALVHVEAPHFQYTPLDVWGDPTHRRPFGPSTFSYWYPGDGLYSHEIGGVSPARFVTTRTEHSNMYLSWDLAAYKHDDPALLKRHVSTWSEPWKKK